MKYKQPGQSWISNAISGTVFASKRTCAFRRGWSLGALSGGDARSSTKISKAAGSRASQVKKMYSRAWSSTNLRRKISSISFVGGLSYCLVPRTRKFVKSKIIKETYRLNSLLKTSTDSFSYLLVLSWICLIIVLKVFGSNLFQQFRKSFPANLRSLVNFFDSHHSKLLVKLCSDCNFAFWDLFSCSLDYLKAWWCTTWEHFNCSPQDV